MLRRRRGGSWRVREKKIFLFFSICLFQGIWRSDLSTTCVLQTVRRSQCQRRLKWSLKISHIIIVLWCEWTANLSCRFCSFSFVFSGMGTDFSFLFFSKGFWQLRSMQQEAIGRKVWCWNEKVRSVRCIVSNDQVRNSILPLLFYPRLIFLLKGVNNCTVLKCVS